MFRALLWKEWREQRSVVGAGLLLVVLTPFGMAVWDASRSQTITGADYSQAMGIFFILFLWPLFAAACGAGTVANEHAVGSLGYLLSRPAPRWKIISSKTLAALIAWVVIVAGSLATLLLVASWFGRHTPGWFQEATVDVDAVGILVLAVSGSVLILSCATFLSNLMRRTMTVAALAIVLALSLMSMAGLYLVRLEPTLGTNPSYLGWHTLAFSVVFMIGSIYFFSAGELLRGRAVFRRAAATAVVLLLLSATLTLAGGWFAIHLYIDNAIIYDARVLPAGDSVLLSLTDEDGGLQQIWSLPIDGAKPVRVAPRHSFDPHVTADGQRVVFASLLDSLGFVSKKFRIGDVRIDGSDLRWIHSAEEFNYQSVLRGALSPNGKWILIVRATSSGISFLSRTTGEIVTYDLSDREFGRAYPVGWSADSTGVLLLTANPLSFQGELIEDNNFGQEHGLFRIDLESGATTMLYNAGTEAIYSGNWSGTSLGPGGLVGRQVPLMVMKKSTGDSRVVSFLLVDSETGEVERVFESFCGGFISLDAAMTQMVYGACAGDKRDGDQSIFSRNLHDGSTRLLATVPGPHGSLWMTPDGDRVLVARNMGPWSLIEADGSVKELNSNEARPLGWSKDGRLIEIIGSRKSALNSLRIRDLSTGTIEVLFPRGKS